jgi:hypothetical protein
MLTNKLVQHVSIIHAPVAHHTRRRGVDRQFGGLLADVFGDLKSGEHGRATLRLLTFWGVRYAQSPV